MNCHFEMNNTVKSFGHQKQMNHRVGFRSWKYNEEGSWNIPEYSYASNRLL